MALIPINGTIGFGETQEGDSRFMNYSRITLLLVAENAKRDCVASRNQGSVNEPAMVLTSPAIDESHGRRESVISHFFVGSKTLVVDLEDRVSSLQPNELSRRCRTDLSRW